MLIVHDTFVCKPGNASKAAKLFKEVMKDSPEVLHIMTDMTGQYHRVIMVSQYENMAAYEKSFDKYMKDSKENQEMAAKMGNFNDMYISGSREMFKSW